MSDEQGLEKASAKTPAVITTPEEYRGALLRWQEQHYNVLTPFTNLSGIAASHGLVAAVVKIETDLTKGEVYAGTTTDGRPAMPFLKGERGKPNEEFAIAKVGLRKLAECAGISTSTVRTDPRTIPYYWEFKAIATYPGLDGRNVRREATFEWDLREGSDRLNGWTANQRSEGRKNGLRACEARAINAAIRECGCGIKQKYTRAELDKPFVVVRVAFQPDMSDPEIKRMVTQQALHGVQTMYPSGAHRELPAAHDVDDDESSPEPRSVGRGSTAPASEPAKPAEDLPPCEGAVRIVKVDSKSGVNASTKKAWTRYIIVDSNGVEHSTFSKTHMADAERFRDEKAWVEIVIEMDGPYKNLVEIIRAGTEPPLPGLDEV